VVGVIVNLALFFGYHTLWPQGFSGSVDIPSAFIAAGAALALLKFKCNVMQVIGVCGVVGICLQYGLK
jgi:chromate transporter